MYNIYHDLLIKASKQSVFEAISSPEHLINWWPLKCTGTPTRGAEYNFYFGPQYDWYAEVSKSGPDSFYLNMTRSDADWDSTSFGFDLRETVNGVEVSFWHKGWPECNQHFKISSYCWAILLKGLKDYLEKGIIVPFEERE